MIGMPRKGLSAKQIAVAGYNEVGLTVDRQLENFVITRVTTGLNST
jgi:hypothetical protein